ncbi:ClbS/DfsB family four-helix bundle protein [Sulfitobacter sp. S190]|uniref:ClbS/DfsB family four-helix bundle protein n=1 Tax=Sulfitobacter sp. S190 TaxID=2867022 RepID=UPI0021A6F69E|nr:ClbS/DfsB family four-helix bundle protein [Sulfitobacter sp. S190]UWR21843.1 ClbS/DfsB family four-helix bundle protein [Sulfitobacter sp. S190]
MACSTKKDLIALTEKEFEKLFKLIRSLSEKDAQQAVDGTTIREIVGHRAHWIDLFLGWYHDVLEGKEVYFPAKVTNGTTSNATMRISNGAKRTCRGKTRALSWKTAITP